MQWMEIGLVEQRTNRRPRQKASATMSTVEKITQFLEAESCPYPTECYALPESDSIIDTIHPETGLTVYCKETLEQIQARYPGAVRMTIEAFCDQKAARQHRPISWSEVTEERYYEMLECLPPAYYSAEGFLVGEPYDHDASNGQPRYQAFVQWNHGTDVPEKTYRQSSRPMTIKEFKQVAVIGEEWM